MNPQDLFITGRCCQCGLSNVHHSDWFSYHIDALNDPDHPTVRIYCKNAVDCSERARHA